MINFLIPICIFLIFGVPLMGAAAPFFLTHDRALQLTAVGFAPVIFAFLFVITAGSLSVLGQRAIIAGKFPRKLSHPVYGPRRLYGLCWTALFYFTPLYFAVLSVPFLKKITFRLFGYRGTTDFTTYPDTWIRDLPLLKIKTGAYLSNKATLGTNLCMKDGTIMVEAITIGEQSILGHLAIIGLGSEMADQSEVGIDVAFGLRCRIGKNSKVSPSSAVNHGAQIGNNTSIGAMSYIGVRAVIGDSIELPGGSNIPSGAIIGTQEEVQLYISSETQILNRIRAELTAELDQRPERSAEHSSGPATVRPLHAAKNHTG